VKIDRPLRLNDFAGTNIAGSRRIARLISASSNWSKDQPRARNNESPSRTLRHFPIGVPELVGRVGVLPHP